MSTALDETFEARGPWPLTMSIQKIWFANLNFEDFEGVCTFEFLTLSRCANFNDRGFKGE